MTKPFGHGIDRIGHGHWPLGQVVGRTAAKFERISKHKGMWLAHALYLEISKQVRI
jgi:hypothetical protein